MSARAIAIHGYEMSGERRANLEIKSECPALDFCAINLKLLQITGQKIVFQNAFESLEHVF